MRTHRAAKLTGILAGTVVLGTALGVGGALTVGALATTLHSAPRTGPAAQTPPAAGPSSASEAASAAPTPPAAAQNTRFADGRLLPDAAQGNGPVMGLTCGADVAPALAATSDATIALTWADRAGLTVTPAHATVRVEGRGAGLPEGYGVGDPVLLWTQDGRVVDAHLWHEGGTQLGSSVPSLEAGASVVVPTMGDAGWACGTEDGDAYPDALPAGAYQVYAIAWYTLPGDTAWRFAATDAVTVALPG